MYLIVCVDEKKGMLFNNRRQSQDKTLIEHILNKTKQSKLWINSFSESLFTDIGMKHVIVDDKFIEKINEDEYCFVENIEPNMFENKIDKIILYNWNRQYPADKYFNIPLDKWTVESENQLSGNSHEVITEQIYVRGEN